MECGPGAFENLDRVHGFERDRQIEVVVRGLAVVDAEAVEQDKGLLKAAAPQDEIGLAAASATLLKEDGRVLAEEFERRLGGEFLVFEGQYFHGAWRLGQRYGCCGAEDHHGFSARGNGGGWRSRRSLGLG